MFDIHTHILPGVDDGAKDLKETLEIIRCAEAQGISGMVASPHYIQENGSIEVYEIREKISQLREVVQEENINLDILTGEEIYIFPELGRELKEGRILSINDSRYVLIEFPGRYVPEFSNNVFYDLKVMGYVPIICHPERCAEIASNPDYLYRWLQNGIYVQLNAGSLLGFYGSEVRKTAELFVKHKYVQLISSDIHSTGKYCECLLKGIEKVKELGGVEMVRICKENSLRIIGDKRLRMLKPEKISEKGVFEKLRFFLGAAGG